VAQDKSFTYFGHEPLKHGGLATGICLLFLPRLKLNWRRRKKEIEISPPWPRRCERMHELKKDFNKTWKTGW
jgi:hypothetical protein